MRAQGRNDIPLIDPFGWLGETSDTRNQRMSEIMTQPEPRKHGATDASNAAHQDRLKIVDLMYDLEAALAAPSFSRVDRWHRLVGEQLEKLRTVLHASREEINSRTGLFAEILEESPWLLPRVERLKETYREVESEIESVQKEMEQQAKEPDDVSKLRRRLGELLRKLREVQAAETELIFEAIGVDLGVGD